MRYLSFDVGVKNLGYCVIEVWNDGEGKRNVEKWGVLDISVEGKTKPSISEITMRILSVLRDNFGDDIFDYVLIENQPCMKNPVMKTVQIIIFTYFHNLKLNEFDSVGNICMVSAVSKLKMGEYLEKKGDDMIECENSEKGYKRAKKLSILYTKHIIANSDEMRIRFEEDCLKSFYENKKQDDMSDSLLQALIFHEKNK
jgi:hypothetical protein